MTKDPSASLAAKKPSIGPGLAQAPTAGVKPLPAAYPAGPRQMRNIGEAAQAPGGAPQRGPLPLMPARDRPGGPRRPARPLGRTGHRAHARRERTDRNTMTGSAPRQTSSPRSVRPCRTYNTIRRLHASPGRGGRKRLWGAWRTGRDTVISPKILLLFVAEIPQVTGGRGDLNAGRPASGWR